MPDAPLQFRPDGLSEKTQEIEHLRFMLCNAEMRVEIANHRRLSELDQHLWVAEFHLPRFPLDVLRPNSSAPFHIKAELLLI